MPINPTDLPPDVVRDLFDYEPETGVLRWRNNSGRHGRIPAGTPAGWACTSGHLQVRALGSARMVHRLAWTHFHNKTPEQYVDHINGIKTDNRISNLRDVSWATNTQNIKRANSLSTHGVLGISKNGKGWKALISVEGKQRYLGTFKTPEIAHAVYLNAKRQLHEGCTL